MIFTFNDTGLDSQRNDQKINYNYITRFKFFLTIYLILTRTPFKLKTVFNPTIGVFFFQTQIE